MKFSEFIRKGAVVKGKPDVPKAVSLLRMSETNLAIVRTIPLTSESASLVLVNAYEALRQVLEAMALIEGYKVFSHEAYTQYLIEKDEVRASATFDRLRKLRNGVNYDGKNIPAEVAAQAIIDIEQLCAHVQVKYLTAMLRKSKS
jgi:hypothetical protein